MIKPESIKDEKTNYEKIIEMLGTNLMFVVIFHKDTLPNCGMGFRSSLLQ